MKSLNFNQNNVQNTDSYYLMCCDIPVYNITTEVVLCKSLLPGLMSKDTYNGSFKRWMHKRYSSNTNTLARKLKGIQFGQGNRVKIDRVTCAFSLSDAYWIKDVNSDIDFRQASPYYNDFWKGYGEYNNGAIPTLYVGGALNKEWKSSRELHKYGAEISNEFKALALCKKLNLECEDFNLVSDKEIILYNFTSPESMLEQADMSGIIDPDDFTTEDILNIFGIDGAIMCTIDAIVANGDRHAGNFGWLRDTATGEYIKAAPLYDFDHAFDSSLEWDGLSKDFCDAVKYNKQHVMKVLDICEATLRVDTDKLFQLRAKKILEYLKD